MDGANYCPAAVITAMGHRRNSERTVKVGAPGLRWSDRVEAGLMVLRHTPQTRTTTVMATKGTAARRRLSLPEIAAGLSNMSCASKMVGESRH